jgi:ABC-type multidrug transport system ATPase subunit
MNSWFGMVRAGSSRLITAIVSVHFLQRVNIMAKKVFISQGGYLQVEGKLQNVEAGTEVELDEEIGKACRFLELQSTGKKVTVATPEKKSK